MSRMMHPCVKAAACAVVAVVTLCGPASAQWPPQYSSRGQFKKQQNNQAAEAIIGGLILGAAINEAMQPPPRQNYNNYNNNYSRPQNYYQQPQYVQPQYIESRPVISRPVENVVPAETVAPKPNVVKAVPKSNDIVKTLTAQAGVADGTAADPLLAVSTSQSVAGVTDTVSEYLELNGTPEMNEAWQKVLESGSSPQEIAKWWDAFGGNIADPAIQKLGPIHVGMSKLVKDLEDGLLSNPGKKAAIDKLADMVADLPANHPSRDELACNIARMRQFQKLGDLLGLASSTPDPIVPILQGTQAMGMPLPLVSEVLGIPLRQSPVADGAPLASGVTIYIVNQSTNEQSVNCSVGGRQLEMKPGTAEPLKGSTSVSFDPGNGSRRSVAVSAGTWGWKLENGLWNLVKVTPQITIDNRDFKGVFHYTVNGKQASVAAGETAEHSHSMPMEVSFDKGNGAGATTKLLIFGTYATGVDSSSRTLNLFRTDITTAPTAEPEQASLATADAATEIKAQPPAAKNRVREALEAAEKKKELAKLLKSLEQPKP